MLEVSSRAPGRLTSMVFAFIAMLASLMAPAVIAQETSVTSGVLRVAVRATSSHPAILRQLPDGSFEGFQKDLIEAIARTQHMRVEYVKSEPTAELDPEFLKQRADIFPLVPVERGASTRFALSGPLVTSPIVAFGKGEAPAIKDAADLAGVRVVVVAGGLASSLLSENGISFKTVPEIGLGFQAVSEGTADYFVETELNGRYALQQLSERTPVVGLRIFHLFSADGARLEAHFAVAAAPGDPHGVLDQIERGLAEVRESGEYSTIYGAWLARYQPPRASAQDSSLRARTGRRWDKSTLRVGIDPNLLHAPSTSGALAHEEGFFPDLMRELGAQMGVGVEFVPLGGQRLREGLTAGRIDVIAGADYLGLDVHRLDFTRPLHTASGVLVMRTGTLPPQNSSAFAELRVVAVKDSSGCVWASSVGFLAVEVANSAAEAVELLKARRVDAAVFDALTARAVLGPTDQSTELQVYRAPGEGYMVSYTIAVRAGAKELLWDLEDAMTAVDRNGKRRAIDRRWLFDSAVRDPQESLYRWPLITGTIGALIVIVLAAAVWVTTLRRELSRRTARLQQEEARLKAITESVPAVVYGYLERPGGKRELRYSNRRLEEWSKTFPALGGSGDVRGLVPVMHPNDAREFERRIAEASETTRRFQQEIRVQDAQGHYRWIQITLDPDPVGEGVLWHGIMQETTELRLAAEALAQSERNFRQIFEATQDAILVFASGFGRVFEANKAALVLYGYTREEMIAMEARELFDHPDDVPASSDASGGMVVRHRRKDGRTLDVECSSAIVQYGGRPAMLSVNRDVTSRTRFEEQRRQLDNQMMQAQKMESLGLLAGGIAHDFNNLLVGIMGNASLASAQTNNPDALGQTLDQIVLTTRRASDLTQQLLAYAGKARLSVQSVNLSTVAAEMVKLLGTRLSRGARMVFSFAPRSVDTMADPVQIRQIVMNLLTNASDALKGGEGVITIRTGVAKFDRLYLSETFAPTDIPEGEYAFLEIADDGCGMDQQEMQRIFDPFFTTKFVGRGLGLSVALSIVQRHRGAIKVFSERDRGTVFRLLLPLATQANGSLIETKPDHSPARARVLLVHSVPGVRLDLESTIRQSGLSVVSVVGVEQAISLLERDVDFGAVVVVDPDPLHSQRLCAAAKGVTCIGVCDLEGPPLTGFEACVGLARAPTELVQILRRLLGPAVSAIGWEDPSAPLTGGDARGYTGT